MDWTVTFSLITSLLSAIAAVLAWAAKLRWSKEYAAAKDEVIKAKEAQIEFLKNEIETLRELSPIKIREYFVSVKTQLEEYIDLQKSQIRDAETALSQKDAQLAQLRYAQEQEAQRLTIGAEMESGITSTLEGWVYSVDILQGESEGHLERVVGMTIELAEAMGIPQEEIVHIKRGALLHDIGKMKIPAQILRKPGRLNEDEWNLLRRHPEFAYDLLSPIEYLRPALVIPRFHHEKWDGTGFPKGIKGTEIPLAARIFAIIDVWDALRTDRLFRAALSHDEALEYIHGQVGTHFDPQVVDAFTKLVQKSKTN
jgi:response regulator RpfG family c-di-GMP phosphodiesterase